MLKPSSEELKVALDAANRLREQDADAEHLAKSLLYFVEKATALEKIAIAANMYINQGQSTHQHTELLLAIENAKRHDYFEHIELLR
ncbi:MAG: hypothetical protein AB1810_00095 [Pseudomonadota bacterium]